MKEIENSDIKLILKLQFTVATCRGYCAFQGHDKYLLKPYSFSVVLFLCSLKQLCIFLSVPWFVVELADMNYELVVKGRFFLL